MRKMPKTIPFSPREKAIVNLTWFARSMEDGESIVDALMEAYDGHGKLLAQDLKVVIREIIGGSES